jgi:hypothetical protein
MRYLATAGRARFRFPRNEQMPTREVMRNAMFVQELGTLHGYPGIEIPAELTAECL